MVARELSTIALNQLELGEPQIQVLVIRVPGRERLGKSSRLLGDEHFGARQVSRPDADAQGPARGQHDGSVLGDPGLVIGGTSAIVSI